MSSKRSSSSSSSFFSFGCGCKDSKSVSVSDSVSYTSEKSPPLPPPPTTLHSFEQHYTSSSPLEEDDEEADDVDVAPSFSGLLRQLSDLEKTILSLAPPKPETDQQEDNDDEDDLQDDNTNSRFHQQQQQHERRQRRTRSEGGGMRALEEESVAVVKETEDPLGDFRRSMLQMIVEKEIVTGEELRQLLKRFLALNSPRHHDVILRAFADIWNEVFSGLDPAPDALRRSRSSYYHRRSR